MFDNPALSNDIVGSENRRAARKSGAVAILVIQHITTKWDKHARGGKYAVLRNAVQEAAKVHIEKPDKIQPAVVYQKLFFGMSSFTEPREKREIDPDLWPLTAGCVTVTRSPDRVMATFQYRPSR